MMSTAHGLILILACFLMFGNYYAYDVPGSIANRLNSWLGTTDDVFSYQLNLLYTIYSLPNIFLPLLGGILVDKLGSSTMLVVFSTLICIGQTVFAVGMNARNFNIMMLGRALFGLGGESLEVAQASITTDWFQDHGLAFALGCNISFARIAAALNDNLSPWIAERFSVGLAGWVGAGTCYFSMIIGVILLHLDSKKYRIAAGVERDDTDASNGHNSNSIEATLQTSSEGYESEEYDEEDDQIYFSQAKGFTFQFWILFLITILLYGSVQPFFHICTAYFQSGKWPNMTSSSAGFAMSVPDIISAIGTPLMGYLTDRYGMRPHLIILSGICIFMSLALMTFTTMPPAYSMSLLGVAYSVFTSSLWPCVPFLVEKHQIATAYGLLSVALNITLTVVPIIIATLRSWYPMNWSYTLFFFLTLSLVSVLFSVVFFFIDRANEGILCQPHIKTDKASAPGTETEPLLDSDILSIKTFGKEEYVAKVISEGLVVSVPRVIIHHHHKIPYNSSQPNHYHTTHCRCFEDGKLQQISTRSHVKIGRRGKSPIRRNFHSQAHEVSASKDSPQSIAASI